MVSTLLRLIARRLAQLQLIHNTNTLRMALGSIKKPGNEAGAVILSLGLGLSVLAAVGQNA